MMKKRLLTILAVVALLTAGAAQAAEEQPVEDFSASYMPERPWETIEVAILLDTSGSMQHLIDAARIKLWEIVNDLTLAEPTPRLRVALVTFGNGKNPKETGWVKLESNLTDDLDLVSERLFALEAAGGSEYVGRVLKIALENLSWTDAPDTLKLVFLTGNEPADQDPEIDFRAMSEEAYARGIELNSIFCGNAEQEDAETWKEVADLGRSRFATINHRRGPVMIETPYDEELAELGAAINVTYVPYGESGQERRANQRAQDENARKAGVAVAASRAQAKSSPLYAPDWDLVDAVTKETFSLDGIEESELPAELRGKSTSEVHLHLDGLRAEREKLRQRIVELGRKRAEYIAREAKAEGLDDSTAFDGVVRRMIREKAEEKGFEFPE
jgi:hypothetical protein